MKKLYVFADFDWLKEPRLVGELSYESLRGSDSYGFCYSNEWLKDYGSLFLSDDLNNYPGQQYTTPGKDIFGCFSDALPDRWFSPCGSDLLPQGWWSWGPAPRSTHSTEA